MVSIYMYYVLLSFSYIDIPPLRVNITTTGQPTLNQRFNLTCTVNIVNGLIIQPTVTLASSTGNIEGSSVERFTIVDETVVTVTAVFDPLQFKHRGVYTCKAEYNISITNDVDSNSKQYHLIVEYDCE